MSPGLAKRLAIVDTWSVLGIVIGGSVSLVSALLPLFILYFPLMWLGSLFGLHFLGHIAEPISQLAVGWRITMVILLLLVVVPVTLCAGGLILIFGATLYVSTRLKFERLGHLLSPARSRPYLHSFQEDDRLKTAAITAFAAAHGYTYEQQKLKQAPDGILFSAHRDDPVTLLLSGQVGGLPFTWYALGSGGGDYDIVRLMLPEFVPHTIINSHIGDAESLLPDKLSDIHPIKLEADAGKYLSIYTPESEQVEALQVLSPDVLLAMLEKTPLTDIELRDQHIDFVWQRDHDTDEMQRRIAAAQVIGQELEHQLHGKPSFAHPLSVQMRLSRKFGALEKLQDRLVIKAILWMLAGIGIAIVGSLVGLFLQKVVSVYFGGTVFIIIAGLGGLVATAGLAAFAVMVYVTVAALIMAIPRRYQHYRLTSDYFLDYPAAGS